MLVSTALKGAAAPSRPALAPHRRLYGSDGDPALDHRQPISRRGVWVAALSIFAVGSALRSARRQQSWWVDLIGHHASLLLALAILHQDYRLRSPTVSQERDRAPAVHGDLARGTLDRDGAADAMAGSCRRRDPRRRCSGLVDGLRADVSSAAPLAGRSRHAVRRVTSNWRVVSSRRLDETVAAEVTAAAVALGVSEARTIDDQCRRTIAGS
jgi:hypothetical protein